MEIIFSKNNELVSDGIHLTLYLSCCVDCMTSSYTVQDAWAVGINRKHSAVGIELSEAVKLKEKQTNKKKIMLPKVTPTGVTVKLTDWAILWVGSQTWRTQSDSVRNKTSGFILLHVLQLISWISFHNIPQKSKLLFSCKSTIRY